MSKSVVVNALVVDTLTGEGGVVGLYLRARRGRPAVRCLQRAREDAVVAVQVAVAAALGDEAERWVVEWELRDAAFPVAGRSLGLAAAVAARAAIEGRALPEGWAFTGAVDLEGRVSKVSSLPGKLRAADAAGLSWVALPAENDVAEAGSVSLAPVSSLGPLFARLLPPRWPLARALAALALGPALALVLAPTPVDLFAQAHLLRLTRGQLPAQVTAVVFLPEDADTAAARRRLRAEHARLVRQLAEAEAAAVVIDLDLSEPAEGDAVLAAAAQEAFEAGTLVLAAMRWDAEGPRPPGDPALRDALGLGFSTVESELRGTMVLGRAVARRAHEGDFSWHLGVEATAARLRHAARPVLEDGVLRVGGRAHPTHQGRLALHPSAPPPRLDYDDPTTGVDLRGRAVIVGAADPKDRWSTPDGPRYGAELLAGLIETLCAGDVPRTMGPGANTLMAAGVAALGAVLPRRRARLPLLLLILGGVLGFLAWQGPVLFAPVCIAIAGLLGLRAGGHVRAWWRHRAALKADDGA